MWGPVGGEDGGGVGACKGEGVGEVLWEAGDTTEGGSGGGAKCTAAGCVPVDTLVDIAGESLLVSFFLFFSSRRRTPEAEIAFVSQALLVTFMFSTPCSFLAVCLKT